MRPPRVAKRAQLSFRGVGRAEGVQGRARTLNISVMLVTLEVSKLSGWLNLYASCREYTKMVMQQFELRAGRRPREAHLEHFGDALDAGRVEAERLVEVVHPLPRVHKDRMIQQYGT